MDENKVGDGECKVRILEKKLQDKYCLVFLFSVSSYTHEAGVRTLERRIGAVCRAVAVKVAERSQQHSKKVKVRENGPNKVVLDENEREKKRLEESIEMMHILPPEMPIVIDRAALEDVLGVRCSRCPFHVYYIAGGVLCLEANSSQLAFIGCCGFWLSVELLFPALCGIW